LTLDKAPPSPTAPRAKRKGSGRCLLIFKDFFISSGGFYTYNIKWLKMIIDFRALDIDRFLTLGLSRHQSVARVAAR
jgi:hypothetical protein